METEEGKRERSGDDSPCISAPLTRFLDKAGEEEEEGRETRELERGQREVRKRMKQNERGGGVKEERKSEGNIGG